ncbi:MAG: hypothetical protein ACI9JZ_001507, partial [Lentimonas sp.]
MFSSYFFLFEVLDSYLALLSMIKRRAVILLPDQRLMDLGRVNSYSPR